MFYFFIGNLIARLISFFSVLQCAFPSKSTMFRCAQKIVRPTIRMYYNNQSQRILNQISNENRQVHLSIDVQYDSPKQNAFYCTVTAIEALSKKIIGFATVSRNEITNQLQNAESAAFQRLITDLSSRIKIASITTDNSPNINKLFAKNYNSIKHYINLWHILRSMFQKFAPKFKLKVCFLNNNFFFI